MATVYEIARIDGMRVSCDDVATTSSEYCKDGKYPGLTSTADVDGGVGPSGYYEWYYVLGPRDALLELKYDLEKKRYER